MARDLDLDKALHDPRAVFGSPEQVLADPRLDRDGKRAILERWEQDARELAVAEEEGMAGGEDSMLERVLRARRAVSGEAGEGTAATTKHGGSTGSNPGKGSAPPLVKDLMRVIDEVVHVDQDLHEAYVRMRQSQVALLPVADGDEIVGILTARDIYGGRDVADESTRGAKVRDHLSEEIAFCYEQDDVVTAQAVMERSGHHRLLVTDKEEQLVGLITLEMITAALRQGKSGRPSVASAEAKERLVETSGRAKGDKPGRPWVYAVRPKLKP